MLLAACLAWQVVPCKDMSFIAPSPCAERRTSGCEASSVTGSAMQREFAALITEQTQAIQKLEQGGATVKVSLQRLAGCVLMYADSF